MPPEDSLTYEFTLPADHPLGTFWYHHHHHGHVTEQLIVLGELDEIPEIKADQEAFMMLQDFDINRAGDIAALNPLPQGVVEMLYVVRPSA